jgi:hypothetical protein
MAMSMLDSIIISDEVDKKIVKNMNVTKNTYYSYERTP